MDHTLPNAALVHNVQRCFEELEQCPEEASMSDSKAASDGDEEHYETIGPRLVERPMVQQKVRHEQPMAQDGHPQGAPDVTKFTIYQPYTQAELVDLSTQFQQKQGESLAIWLL